jgi:hypothetical protein
MGKENEMDPIEIATKKLDDKYSQLVGRLNQQTELKGALEELKATRDQLVDTLTLLAKLKPFSLEDLYSQTNGRVFVSKSVYVANEYPGAIGIEVDRQSLSRYQNLRSESEWQVPHGLYRFVLIAIPQEVPAKKGEPRMDDYGRGY